MLSTDLSELWERLFWQEQNSLAILFVCLWSVEILKEKLQRRKQCFKLPFFPSHWEVCLEKVCKIGLFLCLCHVINHSRTISLPAVYLSNYGIDLIHNHMIWVSQIINIFIFYSITAWFIIIFSYKHEARMQSRNDEFRSEELWQNRD